MIISFAGAIIYMLPYYRYEYYDAYMAMYNLNNTQMGFLSTVYGLFGIFSYLVGGVVADRLPVKLLLSLSLFGTALGGVLHLFPIGYGGMMALYALWGFTSLFAFWPACVKAVRMLAGAEDQGKAFGVFEGGRGLFAALIALLAVVVFAFGNKQLGEEIGMQNLLWYYIIGTALVGVLVLVFFKEDASARTDMTEDNRIRLKDIGAVLKMPATWIISLVTLAGYVFTMSIYYFTPYSTEFFGFTVAAAALVTASRRWISIGATPVGGLLIDKVGTGPVFFVSFLIMAAGTVGIFLLPLSPTMKIPFIVIFMIVYLAFCVNYGLTWSMMDEGKIPVRLSGTAAGIISTIGYLPEVFCGWVAGSTLDKNPGRPGYLMYFAFVVAMLLLGAVFVIIWQRYLKKNKGKDAQGNTLAEPEKA